MNHHDTLVYKQKRNTSKSVAHGAKKETYSGQTYNTLLYELGFYKHTERHFMYENTLQLNRSINAIRTYVYKVRIDQFRLLLSQLCYSFDASCLYSCFNTHKLLSTSVSYKLFGVTFILKVAKMSECS